MRLRWERPRDGLARGFSVEGLQLAQVAHIEHADNGDGRWMVLLLHPEGELFDLFGSAEEAMAAAETAIDWTREPSTGEHD
jgi:hypothetical protein